MGDVVLGIDVGTSSVKGVLCDSRGRVLVRREAGYTARHPAPDRAEQDPEDWWRALVEVTRTLVGPDGLGDTVTAMAVSTQGGTLVPLGPEGKPTRPAILWTDTRCRAERQQAAERVGERAVYDTTGWTLGPQLNLMQTMWVRANEPDVFRRTRQWLSVPDYLAQRLTGRAVLDASNGGVNQFADFRAGRWDPALMDLAGIGEDSLGELLPAGAIIGALLPEAAQALGLRPGTPVVNGGHDQYCVALGNGALSPGDTFIGSGTAWVVCVVTEEPQPDFDHNHCLSRHVVPGRFGALTSLESGGDSLEWWRRLVARGGELPGWDDLAAHLEDRGEFLPVFLPHLHGCNYPTPSPDARGVLWGLEAGHDAWDVAAAVMAGVAFQSAWMLESFPHGERPVILSGGAARSRHWTQLLADTAGLPIRAVTEPEAGARGAALLAGSGVGLFTLEEVALPGFDEAVLPGALADSRQQRYAHFKDLSTELLGVVARTTRGTHR